MKALRAWNRAASRLSPVAIRATVATRVTTSEMVNAASSDRNGTRNDRGGAGRGGRRGGGIGRRTPTLGYGPAGGPLPRSPELLPAPFPIPFRTAPMTPEDALLHEGINLPAPPEPLGVYEPAVRSGNLLFLSGHVAPKADPRFVGRVGDGVDLETAQQAADHVARQMLATVKMAVGSLDRVERPVKVTGFVQCTPEFTEVPAVVNGFSKVLTKVFGGNGRCARSAVGVASLPAGVCVEVEAVFELKPNTPR